MALRDDSARVDDLDAAAEFDAGRICGFAHAIFAADQQRGAEALLHERRGGADYLLLFALGEHDAARLPAQVFDRRRWSTPAIGSSRLRNASTVGIHVDDRTPGDFGVHRRLRDGRRNLRDQPRIERHRNDVIGPVFRPRPVSRRDLVRHVLARQLGERMRRRDFHLHVDGARPHVERAAEDVRKAEHVVDLVRVVGASGRHDGVGTHRRDVLRP